MHETTENLIYHIWKKYYSSYEFRLNDCEENDVKEIAEQKDKEQSEDEEDTILVSENKSKASSLVKIGKGRSSRKESKWVGISFGKLPSRDPLYKCSFLHGDIATSGDVVLFDSQGSDDFPTIIFVEYMFEKSDCTKTIHGRIFERGVYTILRNATDARGGIFYNTMCLF